MAVSELRTLNVPQKTRGSPLKFTIDAMEWIWQEQSTISTITGPKTIKKNTNSTPNKSHTRRARAYEVTSFLSTDCELSTETCSRFLYSLGPCTGIGLACPKCVVIHQRGF